MVLFDFVLAIFGKLVKRFNSNRQFLETTSARGNGLFRYRDMMRFQGYAVTSDTTFNMRVLAN